MLIISFHEHIASSRTPKLFFFLLLRAKIFDERIMSQCILVGTSSVHVRITNSLIQNSFLFVVTFSEKYFM